VAGPATAVIFGFVLAGLVLAWGYFRRAAITRPPIGVMGLGDVAFMLVAIVVTPLLYLALPAVLVAGLLALGSGSVVYFLLEPLVRARWAVWLIIAVLLGADVAAVLRFGPTSTVYFGVNNLVVVLTAVGVANLWAQTGLKARDAALLAVLLIGYDVVASTQLPLMGELIGRLGGLPFAPLLAWPLGDGERWLALGLGDLIMAAVAPLVLRKAFGRPAGLVGLALAALAIGAVLALPVERISATFPVMVLLGPLLALQYGYWRRRGPERTTWQYLQAEPRQPLRVG
jgi:hypothetical protein